ncbi:hypothetical protein CR970_01795 [Candidatus Saccharibacteria bacterium]|nr:MAG: hypothetical protein CR970_01795 [Candidatus Saccharibacteria bacterium]
MLSVWWWFLLRLRGGDIGCKNGYRLYSVLVGGDAGQSAWCSSLRALAQSKTGWFWRRAAVLFIWFWLGNSGGYASGFWAVQATEVGAADRRRFWRVSDESFRCWRVA